MKKIVLLTILVIFGHFVNAQQIDGDVRYGFRTGLNYLTLSGDGFADSKSRLGMHASFFADVPLSTSFALIPELGVSALGVNARERRLPSGDIIDAKINWLQLGLLAKVNITDRFHLLVGPQVGVNVTQKDDNDLYNYDFNAVGGLGYMLTENLGMDLRYGFGLSNIYDNEFEINNDAKNRYFQLGISYRL